MICSAELSELKCALQGLGKRVDIDQIRLQKRGGVGLRSIRLGDDDTLAAIQTARLP